LAIDLQTEISVIGVSGVIELSGGSCPLFDCLNNASETSQQDTAVQQLISEIQVILEGSFEFSYQLVLIYEKIQAFFEVHADWEVQFYAAEIEGFGSFQAFYDICATVRPFVSAPFAADARCCSTSLTQLYQNTSSGLSTGERSDIKGRPPLVD
jgi:hypothetical protein